MTVLDGTLGSILSDPRIRPIAVDAIRCKDLTQDPMWNKTLAELRAEHFGGGLRRGFERLFAAAETGRWYFPLYTEEECAAEPDRRGSSLVWLPSDREEAAGRPWILLVPGGGFENVWNLTEGWPVAAQFNDLGYHVAVLTYQVTGDRNLLSREMDDFARAIDLMRGQGAALGVRWDRYITCGFSAGGYLVCLWNVPEEGFARHGLPKPQACFPVYPVVTWKEAIRYDPGFGEDLFDCPTDEVPGSPYEIPDHVQAFPPSAVFVCRDDALVPPENSWMLTEALHAAGIPCRLETGESGGHGFADGTDMCMAGWTERAVRWYESLAQTAGA